MANRIARQLRKRPTYSERDVWRQLRQMRAEGFHFRRQAPVEGFIVDFACLSQKLIIEVDGAQHRELDHARADADRDAHLRWRGFKVLRVLNSDVRDNIDGVMLQVRAALGILVYQE